MTASQALRALKEEVLAGTRNNKWHVVDDLITVAGHVYILPTLSCQTEILASADETGHEGVQKTLHRLRSNFHLMRSAIQEYVHACAMCQWNKTDHLHLEGLLQPLVVPTSVCVDVAMDFVEGFPRVNGKSVILMVVDRFSKAVHFITLGHPYTATIVACAFYDTIIRLHGIPSSIVSDRDSVFTSKF
jgi:hypothetical protein